MEISQKSHIPQLKQRIQTLEQQNSAKNDGNDESKIFPALEQKDMEIQKVRFPRNFHNIPRKMFHFFVM